MKRIILILTAIAMMAWVTPAVGQSAFDANLCQFYNIEKTVKAILGTGDDAVYQVNTINAFWPVMLNGKKCPKLQEALCAMLTGKNDIKQLDKAIEYELYTDNESVPFGENVPYTIVDKFEDGDYSISRSSDEIELKRLGKRFALFHMFSNIYAPGAAHGMYIHEYITYDTERDKIVTLDDVLIDPELIRPHILKSIRLKYDYTEEDLFLPEDNIPKIPESFYIEDGFLHLVYQVYEIASFAQGDIDVPIFYPNDESYPEFLTPYGKEVLEESYENEVW